MGIYIKDIVRGIQSCMHLFADDLTLYIIVDLPDSAALILNNNLERISVWSNLWLVKFNPNESETFFCSRKRNRVNHPTLYQADTPVKEVSSHKHLGLHLTTSCH